LTALCNSLVLGIYAEDAEAEYGVLMAQVRRFYHIITTFS